jgi:hypothetical protein
MSHTSTDELLAQARRRVGRDLTAHESNTLVSVVIVAEHLAATDPTYARHWLMSDGVDIARQAIATPEAPAAGRPR